MKFSITEARYRLRTGIGCDGMHYDNEVVCKAIVDGESRPLYFLYTTAAGYLFAVSKVNLFLKKYEREDNEPPWIDFFMGNSSSITGENLEDSEYFPVYQRMFQMVSDVVGAGRYEK